MPTPEEIEEEGMTTDEVLEQEFVQPRENVEWVPEWNDHPEERPGENTQIEEDTLLWERDGFEVALESYETTHWKAEVTIPAEVGRFYPREFDLKCHPQPEYGFIDNVEIDEYTTSEATLILQANFQPTVEVNAFIDQLLEQAEQSKEFEKEVREKLQAAEPSNGQEA